MRGHYSAQALCNLVSWPVTSRFPDHLSTVCQPPAEGSGGGQHHSDSPIYRDTGCNLFPSYPLSVCKDDLDHTTLKREHRWYGRLRTTTSSAAAQGGG